MTSLVSDYQYAMDESMQKTNEQFRQLEATADAAQSQKQNMDGVSHLQQMSDQIGKQMQTRRVTIGGVEFAEMCVDNEIKTNFEMENENGEKPDEDDECSDICSEDPFLAEDPDYYEYLKAGGTRKQFSDEDLEGFA